MSEHKYSLAEIDQMRRAVEHEWLFGRGRSQSGMSRTFGPGELETAVEQRLRTYMQNGTDPAELQQAVFGP